MTTAHHDPHAFGAPLTAAEINAPLGQLDAAIETISATAYNVLDYGAVGDGVTNDTVAIQAAVTAAVAGTVFLPPGTFVCGPLTPHDNLRFMGSGKGITIIKPPAGNYTLFDPGVLYMNDVEVSDLTYDGTNQTSSAPGIEFVLGTRIAVRRCLVKNTDGSGIVLYQSDDSLIEGNDVEDSGGDGITLAAGTTSNRIRIVNNRVSDSASVGIRSGDSATDCIILGNTVQGSGFIGIAASTSLRCTISANVVQDSVDNGIDIGQAFDCTVSFNTIDGALAGLDQDMSGAAVGTYCGNTFVGNTVKGSTTGIYLVGVTGGCTGDVVMGNTVDGATGNGIILANMDRCVVVGNVVRNAVAGINLFNATHNIVKGNQFFDDRAGGAKVMVGIAYAGTEAYNTFEGNDFTLLASVISGTPPATDVYRGNPGYNPSPINLFIGPLDPRYAGWTTSTLGAANRARWGVFTVAAAQTVTQVRLRIDTSSGNIDIAIYDEATGVRLGSTGSIASPGTGERTISLTAPVSLLPDTKYRAAFAADNNTVVIYMHLGLTLGPANTSLGGYQETAFPLPNPLTAAGANGQIPLLYFD